MKSIIVPVLSLAFAGVACATPPKLVSSSPADAATGVPIDAIRLAFDQAVLADGPKFSLQALSSQQAAPAIATVNHDGPEKLDLGLASPLPSGRYELDWAVANTAGETNKGAVRFTVR